MSNFTASPRKLTLKKCQIGFLLLFTKRKFNFLFSINFILTNKIEVSNNLNSERLSKFIPFGFRIPNANNKGHFYKQNSGLK